MRATGELGVPFHEKRVGCKSHPCRESATSGEEEKSGCAARIRRREERRRVHTWLGAAHLQVFCLFLKPLTHLLRSEPSRL